MKWGNKTLNFDDSLPVETASTPNKVSLSIPSRSSSIPSEKIHPALPKETIMASQDSCLGR